jgi:hypothetical protein
MLKEKDSFWVVSKTIEAREVCLQSLRRELIALTEMDVQEGLGVIKEEN